MTESRRIAQLAPKGSPTYHGVRDGRRGSGRDMHPPRTTTGRRQAKATAKSRAGLSAKALKGSRLMDVMKMMSELSNASKGSAKTKQRRKALLPRERRPWATYIRPMLGDGTFKNRFRVGHDDFKVLVELLRPALQRDERMGALRNGAIPVEYQLAITLRWLAGASIFEGMDGHVIAKTTAYEVVARVVKALNACPRLDCKWPEGEDAFKSARQFKARSEHEIIQKALGAMDGLFVRMFKPTRRDHAASHSFFSGHKGGHGMNMQAICDAHYKIIAWTMNCPGSQNDRTAFKFSGFDKLLKGMPEGYYILGDAAYPPSDKVLVPFPGTRLSASQDAYNFFQSQGRMAIEQTFGIMVRRWGILWRPLEVRLTKVSEVVNSVVRLHNFCRDRAIPMPPDNVNVTVPQEVQFDDEDYLTNDFFEPEPLRIGRPNNDQAPLSLPREAIRERLEIQGILRPIRNRERNASRTR